MNLLKNVAFTVMVTVVGVLAILGAASLMAKPQVGPFEGAGRWMDAQVGAAQQRPARTYAYRTINPHAAWIGELVQAAGWPMSAEEAAELRLAQEGVHDPEGD